MTGNYLLKLHSGERGDSRNILCCSGPKAAEHDARYHPLVRIIGQAPLPEPVREFAATEFAGD